LTAEGRRQLDEAVAALKGAPLDAVYSSDLQRAVYGGQALAAQTGKTLQQRPGFREVNFGLCEGLPFAEIKKRWPDLAAVIFRPEGGELAFPEGESASSFRVRIGAELDELVKRHPTGSVALVSHAGVGRAVLAHLLGLTNAAMWALEQDHASLNVIDVLEGGAARIKLVNGYLGPEGYHQAGPGFERLMAGR
jgi:broad specificity phosphatase PhoE